MGKKGAAARTPLRTGFVVVVVDTSVEDDCGRDPVLSTEWMRTGMVIRRDDDALVGIVGDQSTSTSILEEGGVDDMGLLL